jgi:hypothetical protein
MGETALTAEELALVASLEEHLAAVARGEASRFVLILSDAGERVVSEVEQAQAEPICQHTAGLTSIVAKP